MDSVDAVTKISPVFFFTQVKYHQFTLIQYSQYFEKRNGLLTAVTL